jgi:hypothetical protein
MKKVGILERRGPSMRRLWRRGQPALWQIFMRRASGRGCGGSEVLAVTRHEALARARADLRRRGYLSPQSGCHHVTAFLKAPRANPCPLSRPEAESYYTLGPRGWARYDITPGYRGEYRTWMP